MANSQLVMLLSSVCVLHNSHENFSWCIMTFSLHVLLCSLPSILYENSDQKFRNTSCHSIRSRLGGFPAQKTFPGKIDNEVRTELPKFQWTIGLKEASFVLTLGSYCPETKHKAKLLLPSKAVFFGVWTRWALTIGRTVLTGIQLVSPVRIHLVPLEAHDCKGFWPVFNQNAARFSLHCSQSGLTRQPKSFFKPPPAPIP